MNREHHHRVVDGLSKHQRAGAGSETVQRDRMQDAMQNPGPKIRRGMREEARSYGEGW